MRNFKNISKFVAKNVVIFEYFFYFCVFVYMLSNKNVFILIFCCPMQLVTVIFFNIVLRKNLIVKKL